MRNAGAHAAQALRNAFLSRGARLFGPRFAVDYLRFAAETARRWGDTGPGTLRLLGRRMDYFDRMGALFLVHEIFVHAAYDFRAQGPAPRVLDCGANIGLSVLFFKARYPDARVTAWEPHPATFARLRANVEGNRLAGVELREAAVSDEAGTMTLYADPAGPGGMVTSMHPEWGGGAGFTARRERLSDAVDGPVDFLKLDVEGAEYAVLDDLAATGALRQVRETVVEWHATPAAADGPARVADTLRSAGMEVETLSGAPVGVAGVLRGRRTDGRRSASTPSP